MISSIPDKFKIQHKIDAGFKWTAFAFSLALVFIMLLMFWMLYHSSFPSLQKFGLHFFKSADWNPVSENFGGLTPIIGTLVTTLIAMIIAAPMSFAIALFLTEICPAYLKKTLGIMIELLAGIPSIIYGMWGLFVLAPIFSDTVQPWMIKHLFFQGAPLGIGIFTAGIVLSIMIIPFITAVLRDAFALVPDLLKESAYALGATKWEVARNIVLPYCKGSIIGGTILGLGRALGETMAVAFVIGNSHQFFHALFMPGSTISSVLANEFSEATGKFYIASLNELGLILFILTVCVFTFSKFFISRK